MSIRSLLDELVPANKAYYNGTPIMTDADFDVKRDELDVLVGLCDDDDTDPDVIEARAFLAAVGAPPEEDSKWTEVTHGLGMTSLNKAQDPEDYTKWVDTLGPVTNLVVSDKCDGISISLRYEAGNLVLGATRGDGTTGVDITRNVLKMKGIKTFIKGFTGYLRGEVVLFKSDWKKHFPNADSARSMANGIAKREDGAGCEHLTILHYQMVRDDAVIPRKSIEFQVLEKLGCAVPRWELVSDAAGAQAVYDRYIASDRVALDYDIDGLVVECDSTAQMEALGDLNKRPRGAVAYKFPPDAKSSGLGDVVDQVGKSGRVTPVAKFASVFLAGANISAASLHNYGNIQRLLAAAGHDALRVGDTIVVSRKNDVIPFVEKITASNAAGRVLATPTHCPECSTPLVVDGEYLMCRGEDCPAQVLGGISRWVKKIGVLGMGDSIIEALIEHAGVTDAADLYVLDPVKCESIVTASGSRLGRTAHIVLAELKSKSEVPLHIFVGSLGIPLCARSVCKMLVDAGFDTLEKMEAATVEDLAGKVIKRGTKIVQDEDCNGNLVDIEVEVIEREGGVPKMGDKKAQSFVDGFAARRTLMDKLLDNGVTIKAKSVGVMTGKSVCFTGVRSPEMEKAIEDAGGTIKGSVGAGLTYLVQKDKASQSGKSQKAVQLGVEITDLDGMWAILGRTPGTGAVQLTAARTLRKATPTTPVVAPPVPDDALSIFGGDE